MRFEAPTVATVACIAWGATLYLIGLVTLYEINRERHTGAFHTYGINALLGTSFVWMTLYLLARPFMTYFDLENISNLFENPAYDDGGGSAFNDLDTALSEERRSMFHKLACASMLVCTFVLFPVYIGSRRA